MDLKELLATQDRTTVEAWCRSKTQHYASGEGNVIARVLGKYLLEMPALDINVTPHLVLNGCWEMWITQALARNILPSMRCVETERTHGYYLNLLADLVGDQGHVSSYRSYANARYEGRIRSGLSLNGLIGRVLRAQQLDPDESLDRELRVGEIHFMKLDGPDTEKAWATMPELRKVEHLQVLMEFIPGRHESPTAFLESVLADGFRIYTVGHDAMIRPVTVDQAIIPDTGSGEKAYRSLWFTKLASEPR